jgi:hypothetical protein
MSSVERNETRASFVVRFSVTIVGAAVDSCHYVGKTAGDNIDRVISSSQKNNDVTDITLLNGALCPGA